MTDPRNTSATPRQPGRLHGRTAIVTGAGSPLVDGFVGVGRAIAVLFAREGAGVTLVDLHADRARETLECIKAESGTAILVEADVTKAADCEAVVSGTKRAFGSVDVLVNNVGIAAGLGRLESFDEQVWQQVMDTNLKSAILMSRCCVPHMAAAGSGSIVNIGSLAGLRASGAGLAYGPSKAALISMSRELAYLHGKDGIRSNVIAPGYLHTPMVAGQLSAEQRTARRKASPLGIEGTAWDVAYAALYLASAEARYVTGVCIAVDGGVTQLGALAAHSLLSQ